MTQNAKTDLFAVQRWAAQQETGNPTRKLVLMAMALHASAEGYTYVGQRAISEIAECTRQTVNKHMASLSKAGLIDTRPRKRADGGRSSNETLLIFRPGITWPDGTKPPVGNPDRGSDADPLSHAPDRGMSDPPDSNKGQPGREELVTPLCTDDLGGQGLETMNMTDGIFAREEIGTEYVADHPMYHYRPPGLARAERMQTPDQRARKAALADPAVQALIRDYGSRA